MSWKKGKSFVGFGIILLMAPAAVYLWPMIGAWTLLVLLGVGIGVGWTMFEPHSGSNIRLDTDERDENAEELSIYDDPAYSYVPGNKFHMHDMNHDKY